MVRDVRGVSLFWVLWKGSMGPCEDIACAFRRQTGDHWWFWEELVSPHSWHCLGLQVGHLELVLSQAPLAIRGPGAPCKASAQQRTGWWLSMPEEDVVAPRHRGVTCRLVLSSGFQEG